jgi:hypothetical protein
MKSLFCRVSKVDEEKRTVTGIGASEAIDAEGEIFDYASSKPYIEAWSEGAQQRSQGKSFGNVREMHQLSAVGKLSEPIVFDDAQRLVILTSYISDDVAWQKCLDGTYTGFSICGPIVGEKWSDGTNPGVKRYTCAPIEFSVCDLPCNEEAVFTAVKAGGVTEERKFKTAAAVEKGADMADVAKKSLMQVCDLANVLGWAAYVQESTSWEREQEGDNSPIPDNLKAWIADGSEILINLAREETSEAVMQMKASMGEYAAKAKKTKTVDGEELPKSAFAYRPSDDLADWKLPIKFSTPEKSKSHIQNALARWSSTDMPDAGEKKKAAGRIRAAAKAHGIEVGDNDLAGKTASASKARRTPVAKCSKALDSMGECLDKTCKCEGIDKCLSKVRAAHADATDAVSQMDDGDADSAKSAAQKAATVAATPTTPQGASPETEVPDMTDAEKAQVAAAETNSAKALEIAEKTNAGMEQIAKALAGLTNLIAGEPVAPKSVTAAAPVAVTKAQEVEGKQPVATGGVHDVAKSIRSNPHYLSNEEAATLHIGR